MRLSRLSLARIPLLEGDFSFFGGGGGSFPDYSNLQQGVDGALPNGLIPKGHPIFWPVPKAIPAWLAATRQGAKTLLKHAFSKTERAADDTEKVLRWAREEDSEISGVGGGEHEKIPIKCNDGSFISRHEQAHRHAKLIHELRRRGAAPDAVGIQNFHSADKLDQCLDTFHLLGTETGLPIHITDVRPRRIRQQDGEGQCAPR